MNAVCVLFLAFAAVSAEPPISPAVAVHRVPNAGIQPQIVRDADGTTHLIYFKGDPAAGDVFYVRNKKGENDRSPVRVNSVPGSAIAIGSIRGAQIAIGRGGRIHVAWNGSANATPRGPSGATPMLYTRSNDDGSGFEKERNVIENAYGLDGGGSVAADASGNVVVAWHATGREKGEAHRRVYLRRSGDDGRTFAAESAPVTDETGACGCCGMKASLAADGAALLLLYRGAKEGIERDLILASASPTGSCVTTRFSPWPTTTCPMSSMSILRGRKTTWAAWEQQGQVYFASIDPASAKVGAARHPTSKTGAGTRKHPVLAEDRDGNLLFAWTEGTGWNRGGSVAWQVYRADGSPVGAAGRRSGVPVWSFAAAVEAEAGGFDLYF